jgi:hypothetical protein
MIERNKNLSGPMSNVVFGLCCIMDGLIRVLSLGRLSTSMPLDYARNQARERLEQQAN